MLTKIITDYLKQHSEMKLDHFMQLALYHPEFGYYSNQQPFGEEGDFITAPEISQVFGELIGAYLATIILQSNINNFNLCELGPGQGLLMSDILRVFAKQNLLSDTNLLMIENSPRLQLIQQQKLKDFKLQSSQWSEHLSQIKFDHPLFIVANEFLDALPIKSFIKHGDCWHEQVIKLSDERLVFANAKQISEFSEYLNQHHPNTKENDIIELNLNAANYIKQIDELIANHGGMAIIIDYGYYQPDRKNYNATLQSLKNHQFLDNLAMPGEADITSHIDFYELSRHITKSKVICPISQKNFLENLGIKQRFETLIKNNPHQQAKLSRQYNRLIDQSQMGELFKIMIIHQFDI